MKLEQIGIQVCEIAKEAANYIRSESSKIHTIETKAKNSFVTEVDKNTEKFIVKNLAPLIKEAGFITEEETIQKKGEKYNWIIDPLDGTTNFIHGVPCYCVSIALMEGNAIILGVIYEVNLNECFFSWKGEQALLNGKKIQVSITPNVEESLLATGFPYYDFGKLDGYLEIFKHLMQNSRGLRRPGSACADLAYTAAGRFDGFYEYSLNAWDVAAGSFLVTQAGGKCTDFSGGKDFIFGKTIISTNKMIHQELQGIIQKYY